MSAFPVYRGTSSMNHVPVLLPTTPIKMLYLEANANDDRWLTWCAAEIIQREIDTNAHFENGTSDRTISDEEAL